MGAEQFLRLRRRQRGPDLTEVVMSGIVAGGIGAVSPAGWGVKALRQAIWNQEPCPVQSLQRPGLDRPWRVRAVPTPAERPPFFQHPRLRRSSPITRFALGAALEAMGKDAVAVADGVLRLGIVTCAMSGCVNYT